MLAAPRLGASAVALKAAFNASKEFTPYVRAVHSTTPRQVARGRCTSSLHMAPDIEVSVAPAEPQLSPSPFLSSVSSLKAVLFDVDGTLADSDPLHFLAFREILQEVGFQGGMPIDQDFFRAHISGRHNPDIGRDLFPDWSNEQYTTFFDDKEERFRRLAAADELAPVEGLFRLCDWVKEKGLNRAAVTNAPRLNAEQMIASLGLSSFFDVLIIGAECERAKPHPDPYLAAMKALGVSAQEAIAFEDSPSGIRAAVAANLATVAVMTGQTEEPLQQAGATLVLRDFSDSRLWDVLKGVQ